MQNLDQNPMQFNITGEATPKLPALPFQIAPIVKVHSHCDLIKSCAFNKDGGNGNGAAG